MTPLPRRREVSRVVRELHAISFNSPPNISKNEVRTPQPGSWAEQYQQAMNKQNEMLRDARNTTNTETRTETEQNMQDDTVHSSSRKRRR